MENKNYQCPMCESFRTFINEKDLVCNNCGESAYISDIQEDLEDWYLEKDYERYHHN